MALDTTLKLLIVDDQITMLRIIRNMLNQLGFQNIEQATDGTRALEELSRNAYDMIISDWNMEPMTGFDLLKTVRATPELKSIPFIMVTGESKKENIMAAIEAGVNNYIIKPFNADTLKVKMEHVLKNRK